MKHTRSQASFCRRLLLGCILCLAASGIAQGGEPPLKVDWQQFFARLDPLWDGLPETWDDAAFLGNGLMGALVYRNGTNELGWDIGRSDVTDHQQGPNPMFRRPRLPIGRMVLLPVGKIEGGSARLDLWNAEARGVVRTDRGEIAWRSLIHTEEMLLIVLLEAKGGEQGCRWEFRPEIAVNPRKIFRKLPLTEADNNPPPSMEKVGEAHVCSQHLKAGGEYATAWKEVRSDGKRVLYLSVGNTFEKPGARDEAVQAIEKAAGQGVDALVAAHRQWWHSYYPQSFLSLPDTRLEAYYWIQMYKLASATRADRPALDNMGPWYGPTPWPGIWWDLNIQVAYSPVYAANRLELGQSLTRMLDRNRQNLILNAPKAFQHDSAAIGLATSYDCRDDVDADPASGISWAKPGYETLGNLVWACHNYWLQYRYSMDDKMLREGLYPLLTRAVNFYLHLLTPGRDGKLHLPEAWSPEYFARASDTNYDLALLRWGCQTLIASAARLKIDDPLVPRWKETLAKLAPYPTGETGFLIGRGVPLTKTHRHYSHLLGVYPLRIINYEDRRQCNLINRSLDHWASLQGAFAGFSCAGASGIASGLGHGDDALRYLKDLLDKYVEANTLYREAGPCIETPLLGACAMQELVLQSWGGKIRVFPAVPRDWQDVAFYHLRAEGAFLVSAVRRGAGTQFISITSLAGEPCRLKTDLAPPFVVQSKRTIAPEVVEEGVVELDLHQGETATIYTEKAAPALAVEPVLAEPWRTNYYGSMAASDRAMTSFKGRVTRRAKINQPSAHDAPGVVLNDSADHKPAAGAMEPRSIHIVLTGDSTVTDGAGWGKAFADRLYPTARCTNLASGGQSSKSFLDQGRWKAALALHPTHIFIQFGHNDGPGKGPQRATDPKTTYRANLTRYVDEARAAGTLPILVTSIPRRSFKDGKLEDDLAPYVEAMKTVAAEKHVTVLDLHARGIEAIQRMGPEASEPLGPISKDGRRDHTHLAPPGRDLTARQLISELREALPELAKYVRPERGRNP